MANVGFIQQVALGTTSAVNLGSLFTGEMGGNSFLLKCVSGSFTVGLDNTVTATNGYPMVAGETLGLDSQSFRGLWVIGGAADRVAVVVEG